MRRLLAISGTAALLATLATAAHADAPSPAPPAATAAPQAPDTPAPPAASSADAVAPPDQLDAATRDTARRIAVDGLSLFDTGHYADALDRFEKAGSLVQAPTMGLMQARSLEKLGRWVEASERYLAVTRMELADGASDAFKEAQTSAVQERAALMPRIPSLVITVRSAPAGAAVTLDGRPIAAALLGVAFPVDPGSHAVALAHGTQIKTQRFVLKEAEAHSLVLALDAPPPPLPLPLPPAGTGLRTAGWIGVALGGVGIAFGAVASGLAVSANSDLIKAGCADGACRTSESSASETDVARYRTLRDLPAPAFIAGGVVAAAGVIIVTLSHSRAPVSRQGTARPWIGPAGGGVSVNF